MNEFKDMLKYLRERDKLSQSELAKKLGVSKSTISMYELGNREPDFETEEAIADTFNVSLDFLRGKSNDNNSLIIEMQPCAPEAAMSRLASYFKLLNSDGRELLEDRANELIKLGYTDSTDSNSSMVAEPSAEYGSPSNNIDKK